MYKPLQIQAPQTRNTKNSPIIRPGLQIQAPGVLYSKIFLKFKIKQLAEPVQ